ncbi:tyrosine-type recombinase/integrase [Salininema proteolyticum]|uniref:Tyrosine-type recombinase/integrase n=1 Tax=Salininema proteolyticum TaxID=1607685 RepID=A0ABV8TXG5_9ACTN
MWVEPHRNKFRIRDLVDGRKVPVESGFANKTAAKNRMKELEGDKIKHGSLKPNAGKTNFGQWAEEWWKSHSKTLGSKVSVRTEGGRVKRHVIGRLGHLTFGQIDRAAIRQWLSDLAEPESADYDPLGPKSILNVHGYLFLALETAVKENMIRVNPATGSKLPKWNRREPTYLDERQLAEVLGKLPVAWRPLFLFVAGTGCRIGEALGMKWECLDLDEGTARFESQVQIIEGKSQDVPLKTKASRRTISLPSSLVKVLKLLPHAADGYVFRGSQLSRPARYTTALDVWSRSLRKTAYAALRIHDLRHSHAAQLIKAKRPLTVIQRRLGHSSIKVTSDTYGGLLPEVESDTAAAAELALSHVALADLI